MKNCTNKRQQKSHSQLRGKNPSPFGGMKIHTLRLVRQADGTLRLFHDANGDAKGAVVDGIIAFRLSDVPKPEDGGKYENITLKWNSFSGEKSHTFKYKYRE